MSQIASSTKKLQLLEKAHEIEEEERERTVRNLAQRTAKFNQLKSQNDLQCLRSATETELRQETNERKALLFKLKESMSEMPWMQPLADLLENNQGYLLILYLCSFAQKHYTSFEFTSFLYIYLVPPCFPLPTFCSLKRESQKCQNAFF